MAFDMSLVQRGARLRRSPFYEAEQQYGPKGYTVYNHMLFPTNFDDFEAEYWHLLNHVTLWDVAVERNLEVQGRDGFRFAQLLTPRDLSKCAVGQGKYVLITAPDGGIVNDPVMLRLGENHFWFALASSDALLYAIGLAADLGWDVQLGEPDVSPVQIQGPASKDVVSALFGEDILSLKYYWFREITLDGIPLIVTRTGWTAEVGYEIYLRDGRYGERAVGADHGGRQAVPDSAHRSVGHPPGGGRHPELGRRHDHREQRVRGGPGAAVLARRRLRVPGQGGAAPDPRDGRVPQARGRDDRRRTDGHELHEVADPRERDVPGGRDHRPVVPAAGGQHRVRVASRRAGRGRQFQVAVTTPTGERTAIVTPMPFIDPDKAIPKAKQSAGAGEVGLR